MARAAANLYSFLENHKELANGGQSARELALQALGWERMKKAGGIVAIIAGVFGVLSAGVTLVMGGMSAAFEAEGSETVIGLGWGGVIFSFAVIILGAVALGASGRVPAILLIVSSVLGAILGGTLVAIFMVLSLVGGILAFIGTKKSAPAAMAPVGAPPNSPMAG